MQNFIAVWSTILNYFIRCPQCGKQQHFENKKGDTVKCKKCGHEFVLK